MTIFLETKRLLLETQDPLELQHWILLRQDPVVMQYIGNVKTKEEIENFFFDVVIPYHKKHRLGFCSVFEKESGSFVGQAGLFHIGYDDTQTDIEVAYRFLEKFWGKGYATELSNALITFGFSKLPVKKLVGFAWLGNAASSRVLQKAGMHFVEKKMGDQNQEILRYEIDKDTFQSTQKSNLETNGIMKIRLLTVDDWKIWKDIRLEALQNSPENFGSAYEEELNWPDAEFQRGLTNNNIFGVFIENKLAACAGFYSLTSIKTKHRGVIWGMYTRLEYRKQGIASALIQTVITHAKSRVSQIHLTCVTSNVGGINFYQKQGFKIYGTEPRALKISDRFFDEHLMALALTE